MPMSIVAFEPQHTEAVRQFNQRLADGAVPYRFATQPVSQWLPQVPGRRLFQEYFLALDEQGAVRGAYILKHQDYQVADRTICIGDFQFPLSESLVDRQYAGVATRLLFDCLKRNPYEYGLGIGGMGEPVAKLVKAGGWTFWPVPFLFRVFHPWPFLRRMAYLRRHPLVRLAADAAAFSGMGYLGVKALHRLKDRRAWAKAAASAEVVDRFDTWADDVWKQCRDHYRYLAVRDLPSLDILYPAQKTKFIRLRIRRDQRTIGWAVCLNTPVTGHKQFGDMRLGSLVDALAAPADAETVIGLATRHLQQTGADLAITNQSHRAWSEGCRAAGFLSGPTNFLFARSRALTKLLQDCRIADEEVYLNRGDGDGPIHL